MQDWFHYYNSFTAIGHRWLSFQPPVWFPPKPPALTASLPPCQPPFATPSKDNATRFVFLLQYHLLPFSVYYLSCITNHPKSLSLQAILIYYFSQFCSSAERLLCWGHQGPLMWLHLNYKVNCTGVSKLASLTCLAVGADQWLGCLGFPPRGLSSSFRLDLLLYMVSQGHVPREQP